MKNYDVILSDKLKMCRESVRQINRINGNKGEFEDIQTLLYFVLSTYYGDAYEANIYLAFLGTKFIPVDKSMRLFLDQMEIPSKTINASQKYAPGTFLDVTVKEFTNKETKKKSFKFDRKLYFEVDGNVDIDVIIESMAKQLNQVANSINHPVVATRSSLAARTGVSYETFRDRVATGVGLENIFQQLQLEEIMQEADHLCEFELSDEKVWELAYEVQEGRKKRVSTDTASGMVAIISPLYFDEHFNPVLVDSRMKGTLRAIDREFSSHTEEGAYAALREYADVVSNPRGYPREKEDSIERAKTLVKTYIDSFSTNEQGEE